MRKSFINAVMESCPDRDDIFLISGDAGLGVLDEFKARYPERYLNLGVAEQNAAGFASGMAIVGFKVYIYNIAAFLLYRCYEQVRNDICYQRLPVVLVGAGSGLSYAPAGISHYSVEDIGLARTLPDLTVISPCDTAEAAASARYCMDAEGPVYVRIAKDSTRAVRPTAGIDITRPQVIRHGEDIAILFHGSISGEVMAACDELTVSDIHPMIVSVPMLQPVMKDALLEMLNGKRFVLTVEEHFAETGLGGILEGIYSMRRPSWGLKTIGVGRGDLSGVLDAAGLRKHAGLTSTDIAVAVKGLLGQP